MIHLVFFLSWIVAYAAYYGRLRAMLILADDPST